MGGSGVKVKLVGLDALQVKLKGKATLDDVRKVVKTNGMRMTREMKAQTKKAYVKGYTIGDTAGSIELPKITDNGMTATVGPTTDYSPYVEWGTRYMSPEPIVEPTLTVVGPKFLRDLQRITGE